MRFSKDKKMIQLILINIRDSINELASLKSEIKAKIEQEDNDHSDEYDDNNV